MIVLRDSAAYFIANSKKQKLGAAEIDIGQRSGWLLTVQNPKPQPAAWETA